MTNGKIERIIHAALFTPTNYGWGLPLHCWGAPGVGKSAILRAIAGRIKDFPLEILSPGERGEGAFGVTPVPGGDGYLGYPPPDWKRKFDESGRGLVFIDEANTAPPAMQPAMLGLFLERRIGGQYLGKGVRLIMAANPVEMSAGGWDYPAPTANRMGHVTWEPPTVESWCDWLVTGELQQPEATIDAEAEEQRVMAAWPAAWAKATMNVQGFLRARSVYLHKQPPAGHPDSGKAWPSPRSWEFATRAIAASSIHGLDEEMSDEFAGAFVGHGTYSEFCTYRREADLPNPEELLAGKGKFKHKPERLDRTFAVLGACAQLVANYHQTKDKRLKQAADVIFALLVEVANHAMDVTWQSAQILSKCALHKHNADSKKLYGRLFPAAHQMSQEAGR